MSRADRFLKACRREPVDTIPIWLMRQAGRYMPVYRALREKYGILEIIKEPDLAMEVTLQPINAFELDAAIIFADILPPLEGMGLHLEFVKGDGPVLHNPIRTPGDVESLATPPAEEALGFTIEAVRRTRKALNGIVPLIGFSAAPFTLASYAIEGGGSKTYARTKAMMYGEPKAWHRLMEKLSIVIVDYLRGQAKAGAQALQLFDSWVGALSPYDYQELVQPYVQRIIASVKETTDVPIIYFGTGTAGWLETYAEAGSDVIGVDWRVDIAAARERLGNDITIQGNLDPQVLLGPVENLKRQAARILDSVNGGRGYIFNLGHGILKETPESNVAALVDFVHEHGKR